MPWPARSRHACQPDEASCARCAPGDRASDVGNDPHEKGAATSSVWLVAGIFVVALAALGPAAVTAQQAPSEHVKPFFLVATREMPDPVFQQSVILMLPSAQIPLVAGVIINRPTTIPVRKLFPHAADLKNRAGTAYFGGPVDVTEPSLLVRGSQPSGKGTRLFDDVYLSTDPSSIAQFLKDPRGAKDLRLLLGRAQWTRDQVRAEILERSWYMVPAQPELVFSPDPGHIWRVLVEHAELQEVDATGDQDPDALVLLRLRASPLYPTLPNFWDPGAVRH